MALLCAALALVLVALAAGALRQAPADAAADLTPARIAGSDRADTAARLAPEVLASGDGTALVATDAGFADALAAAGLAGALSAPLLLTSPDMLSPATAAALEHLGIARVLLLGGAAAVSTGIETTLAHRGLQVERLAGDTREATAASIARRLVAEAGGLGTVQGRRTVLLADGGGFADALAAGALAAAHQLPILLARGDGLPPATVAALAELAPEQIILLGGPGVLPEAIAQAAAAPGVVVRRVGGATRTGTAALLADMVLAEAAPGEEGAARRVFLVRGDDFPDALAAGPHAAAAGAPVLLTAAPDALGEETAAWLARHCGSVRSVTVIGGSGAVDGRLAAEARQTARTCQDRASLPVQYVFAAAAADRPTFADEVAVLLDDPRSWSVPGVLQLHGPGPAAGAPDAVLSLSPPPPACGVVPACRDGDLLLIDPQAWVTPPADWSEDSWRAYLVNHLVGLWLGVEPVACTGGPASVMVELAAARPAGEQPGPCPTAAWPSEQERAAVTDAARRPLTVAFAGDVHGEGVLRSRLLVGEDPLDPVAGVLSAADLAVVNLETAIGSSGQAQAGKTYTFQAPAALAASLVRSGVDVVTLANNHALDFGRTALGETLELVERAGLVAVGAGRNAEEAYAPAILEVGGYRVAIVGLSRVLSGGWAAGAAQAGLASAYDEDAAVAAVERAAAQADFVIVAIHWGRELAECPDEVQRRLATKLVAAGADVVAGHHPHILQGIDQRDGALVAYSLGNFAWYHDRAPSRDTGVLTVTLPLDAAEPRFDPAQIRGDGSPHLLEGAAAARIQNLVAARSPGGGACG